MEQDTYNMPIKQEIISNYNDEMGLPSDAPVADDVLLAYVVKLMKEGRALYLEDPEQINLPYYGELLGIIWEITATKHI